MKKLKIKLFECSHLARYSLRMSTTIEAAAEAILLRAKELFIALKALKASLLEEQAIDIKGSELV